MSTSKNEPNTNWIPIDSGSHCNKFSRNFMIRGRTAISRYYCMRHISNWWTIFDINVLKDLPKTNNTISSIKVVKHTLNLLSFTIGLVHTHWHMHTVVWKWSRLTHLKSCHYSNESNFFAYKRVLPFWMLQFAVRKLLDCISCV